MVGISTFKLIVFNFNVEMDEVKLKYVLRGKDTPTSHWMSVAEQTKHRKNSRKNM